MKALTKDHHSYFASWDGQRIVISRTPATPPAARSASSHPSGGHGSATATPAGSAAAAPSVVAVTMLLDPATGAAQRVALTDAWLPAVDPTGRLVVFWSGTLTAHGPTVDLTAGSLFIADWSAATGLAPVATPSPSAAEAAGSPGAGSATPAASPATTPSASAGDAGPTPPLTGPTAAAHTPRPSGSAGPTTGSTPPSTSPSGATASPTTDSQPVTQTGTDVTDWLVRWAPDGSAYGIWTADAPGSDAGTLTVVAAAGTLAGQDLLGSTPAQRAFSLSDGRVAWVTPDSIAETGDLRVVTWGADGPGGVHIPVRHGVTLAF